MEDTNYSTTVSTPVEDLSDTKTITADRFDTGSTVSIKATCPEDMTVDESKIDRDAATITVK